MTWYMFAHAYEGKHQYAGREMFMHIGHFNYVKAHMLDEPIVPVVVNEKEDGDYWGWIDVDKTEPTMIWPTETQFRMCFTYGPDAEVARGKGRIVRLSLKRGSPPFDEVAKSNGFSDAYELHRLVAQVDISTVEKMAAFKKWQRDDGTKAGLLRLEVWR